MATQAQIDTQDATAILAAGFWPVFATPANIATWNQSSASLPPYQVAGDVGSIAPLVNQGYLLLRSFQTNLVVFSPQTHSAFTVVTSAIPGTYNGPAATAPPPPPPPPPPAPAPPPPPP